MARPRKARPTSVKIYEGADGVWHGYLTVGVKPNGQPDRRHRSGKTEQEVADKIRKLEDERAAGQITAVGRPEKFGQLLAEWLEHIRPHVSYNTYVHTYEYAVRLYLAPELGGHFVEYLEQHPDLIDKLYVRLVGTEEKPGPLSPGTVALIHRTGRTAVNWALEMRYMTSNPFLRTRDPEPEPAEIQLLTTEQRTRLLEVLAGRRNGVRWKLAMLGPRQGEVLGLRREDLDAAERVIAIQGQAGRRKWRHGCKDPAACAAKHCRRKPCPPSWQHGCSGPNECPVRLPHACPQRKPLGRCRYHARACPPPCPAGCTGHASACPEKVGGGVVLETAEDRGRRTSKRRLRTKTKKSVRRIGVPQQLVDELGAHFELQDREREHAGSLWVEHGLMFCTPTGHPIDAKRDWDDWQEIRALAGLPDGYSPHKNRHDAATMAMVLGIDRQLILDQLGWSSEKMLATYQHIADELRVKAADAMGAALFGVPAAPVQHSATDHATGTAANVIDFASRRKTRRSQGA
jgi:integrase